MNARHSKLTDRGLEHVAIEKRSIILDVDCGGRRTVSKLAAMAAEEKVYGLDFSEASVAASKRTNALRVEINGVEIQYGSVSQLMFSDGMFNVVTAGVVE